MKGCLGEVVRDLLLGDQHPDRRILGPVTGVGFLTEGLPMGDGCFIIGLGAT